MTSEKQPFVPVPQKPTHDMMQATLPTVRSIGNLDQATAGRIIHAVYDLMIETAPPPPGVRLSDKQHRVLTAICQMYDKRRQGAVAPAGCGSNRPAALDHLNHNQAVDQAAVHQASAAHPAR
jgi:hypothetical protein